MRMRGNVSLLPNVAASATAEDGNGTKGVSSSTAISEAAKIGPMTWPSRSIFCGSVSEDAVGREVTLCGWVDGYRNFGGVLFLDIRDHTGLVQVRSIPPPPPVAIIHGGLPDRTFVSVERLEYVIQSMILMY